MDNYTHNSPGKLSLSASYLHNPLEEPNISALVSLQTSRASSQPTQRLATSRMPSTAQKILQMSYMELLCETARPEPRLRRILGHVGIYENASLLCRSMEERGFCPGREVEKTRKDEAGEDESRRCRPVRPSSTKVQRVRTFSGFQAITQSELERRRLCNVTSTGTTEGSDGSDDSDGSDESDESDDSDKSEGSGAAEPGDEGNDDSVLCESEHVVIERVELVQKAILSRDSNDLSREISRCRSSRGERDDDGQLWQQQPRVFTHVESEQAFYNVWR